MPKSPVSCGYFSAMWAMNEPTRQMGDLQGFLATWQLTRLSHTVGDLYGLQALEPIWITAKQIEAGRRAMTRYARRGGKIWVRIFPDKPLTVRPTETRMSSGKRSPEFS
ncbi:hypothetical protein KSP40_PGU002953 [Platanthera guangdongensis]|uniref:50S ribosomal protein L16, chloroplastic n=1 Tax=Platanthera guangdongensis TaxID=2320717 RepID=A0ABR2M2Z4_9ASPA